MLSDRDRETLDEIQQCLATDDPHFARSFEIETRRLTVRELSRHKVAITILTVVMLMLSGFMIMVRAPGPAFFFAVVAGCLIWLRQGRQTRDGHQGP